ncbi:MAG: hypothetical protein ABIV36_10255 [Sphingobium limneticum]
MCHGLHDRIAASHVRLQRGMVWCRSCGRSARVDPAGALRHGWPRCCNATMTIDAPEERLP